MRAPLDLCDIVKISSEETLLMSGFEAPSAAAAEIMRSGPRLVIVTLGEEGAYWRYRTRNGVFEEGIVPGFKVDVVDINGAGDTFFGAFASRLALKGLVNDLTVQEINEFVRFANRAASISVSRSGAIPGMPKLEEVVSSS